MTSRGFNLTVCGSTKGMLEMKYLAIKKWKDGSETTMEYFESMKAALVWIQAQPKPKGDEFVWCVGEYD